MRGVRSEGLGDLHLIYVDESYDQSRFVMTGLVVEDASWRAVFNATKAFRQRLKADYGIRLSAELHAKDFVRDCSDGVSIRKLSQSERRHIFDLVLAHMSSQPIALLNVCLDVARFGGVTATHRIAVERLANRVQTMTRVAGSYAIGIFDEGKEAEVRRLVRRMSVYNPIPSAFGGWTNGTGMKNIVLDRFLEDPFFKSSHASYFLQLVDFAAWSLLKREVAPSPFIARFEYQRAHQLLEPICFRPASRNDRLGIVR